MHVVRSTRLLCVWPATEGSAPPPAIIQTGMLQRHVVYLCQRTEVQEGFRGLFVSVCFLPWQLLPTTQGATGFAAVGDTVSGSFCSYCCALFSMSA